MPNLTEAAVKTALKERPKTDDLRLYDDKVPGLLLWRRTNGKPRWYLFQRVMGRMKRLPVGDVSAYESVNLETARDLARQLVARLAAGEDVAASRRVKRVVARERVEGGKVPLEKALGLHLKELARRGRDGAHVKELARVTRLAKAAGVVDLADPGVQAKARTWLESLDVREPTRHRYRVHLLAVAKTALANWPAEALPRDPFLGLRGKGAAMPVPAVFNPSEAVKLASDPALALPGGRLWCFLLLTGCRFKEASWSRWGRINLDRCTFDVVPPDADEYAAGSRVKRMKARTVHLGHELVALLRSWKPDIESSEGFLFDEQWRNRPHVYNVRDFRSHLKAMGIPLGGRKIHSLRHTRQTLGLAAGEDSLRLRLSMGHAGEDMAAHYGQLAMRWRGLLSDWNGDLKLRDPIEAKRITAAA